MGSVYKVRDKNIDAILAVKVLQQNLVQDQAALKRFEQEADAARKLSHPNLVSVYDHGTTNIDFGTGTLGDMGCHIFDQVFESIGLTAPLTAAAKSGLAMPALFAEKRNPALPDVPTMTESGYQSFTVGAWTALLAPKGTPSAIIAKLNAAYELRDKTCRDVRQTTQIAFNDVGRLQQQIGFLAQHELSTAKAREAYRQQFDIGQRSLLDLLDTENELYQARRALTNAGFDLRLAKARVLATSGTLLSALQLRPIENEVPPAPGGNTDDDDLLRCSTELPAMMVLDKEKPPEAEPVQTTAPVPKPMPPVPAPATS